MWEIIYNTLLSIIIIVLLHYIYDIIKNKYTKKTHMDVLETQTELYKNVINDMTNEKIIESENIENDLLQHALDEVNNNI